MQDTHFNKTYTVNFAVTALGDGLWGLEAGHVVNVVEVVVDITVSDMSTYADVSIWHDVEWDDGLVYTDGCGVEIAEKILALTDLHEIFSSMYGSEQGMQCDLMFNCDADFVEQYDDSAVDALAAKLLEMGFDAD